MFSTLRNTAVSLGVAALGLSLVAVPKADAAYIAFLYQDGSNVVDTGSGSINTTDLSILFDNAFISNSMDPSEGYLATGIGNVDVYRSISGAPIFGPGGETFSTVQTGDRFGAFSLTDEIDVPHNYVSGSALHSGATWDNTTLAALGATPGTYTWTWGSGANADSFTLHIGEAPPVPEPASLTVLAVGLAGLGMVLRTRRA
jgi:hypothetical protein